MRIDQDQRQARNRGNRIRFNQPGQYENPFAVIDSLHALGIAEATWVTKKESFTLLHHLSPGTAWCPRPALERLETFLHHDKGQYNRHTVQV